MLVYNTLSEAMPHRRRPGATGLILSLDGAVYFVFHSYQSRDQLASSSARAHINITNEINKRNLGGNYKAPSIEADQQKWRDKVLPVAKMQAEAAGIQNDGRHAEEVMIESWDKCCVEYRRRRNGFPSIADVFLEFSPCKIDNHEPSPARPLAGRSYPVSCQDKLREFCNTGDRCGVKWRIYWDQAFQGLASNIVHGNMIIQQRPSYMPDPKNF